MNWLVFNLQFTSNSSYFKKPNIGDMFAHKWDEKANENVQLFALGWNFST